MTDQATQGDAVASDERFGAEAQPAELARLGFSLDTLLDRIRTVLRHEQQLTGELSHELRTLLTRIVIELDWWQARPRTAAEAAQSLRAICDTLLDDARDRARNASTTPGTTSVAPVLRRLVETLDAPEQVKIVVGVWDPGLRAGVAPAFLERTVSLPLANAVRYAHSAVTMAVRRLPGGVRIDVTDDGPGRAPARWCERPCPTGSGEPRGGHPTGPGTAGYPALAPYAVPNRADAAMTCGFRRFDRLHHLAGRRTTSAPPISHTAGAADGVSAPAPCPWSRRDGAARPRPPARNGMFSLLRRRRTRRRRPAVRGRSSRR